MPASQPSLTLTKVSATQFQATLSGDSGNTIFLYYRKTSNPSFTLGGQVTTSGSLIITVTSNASIEAYAIANDGAGYSLPTIKTVFLGGGDTVSGAFVRSFEGNVALMAVCPQIWIDEIPETDENDIEINLPWAVLELPNEIPNWQFEESYWIEATVRLTIATHTAEDRDSIIALVQDNFDWQPLAYLTERSVWARWDGTVRRVADNRDRDGQPVFLGMMNYSFAVTRTKP